MQCSHRFADVRENSTLSEDPDEFRSRFTHNLMETDRAYYEHLLAGEQRGRATHITTELVMEAADADLGQKDNSWLDIGCGSGYLLKRLKDRGVSAIGIEPGGWGQIAAQDKGVEVVQGFLAEGTFTRRFDWISALDMLEHQADPAKALRLIRDLLTPGGKVFISVPFADSLQGWFLKYRWRMVEPPTHCQFFTKRSFNHLIEKEGFVLARTIRYTVSYPRAVIHSPLVMRAFDGLLRASWAADQAVFILEPAEKMASPKLGIDA